MDDVMNQKIFKKYKEYMLEKVESSLDFPFGDDVSVFKILESYYCW